MTVLPRLRSPEGHHTRRYLADVGSVTMLGLAHVLAE